MWHCVMIVTVCLHFRKLQAFIDEYPFLQYYLSKQRSCILKVTREPIAQSGFVMVVKKGSPWKSHLSNYILKYKGEGTIEKLDKKWVAKVCTEKSDILPGKVPSSYFGGLIITLAIFVSVSLTIRIFEHIYQRYHCKMGTARKVTPRQNWFPVSDGLVHWLCSAQDLVCCYTTGCTGQIYLKNYSECLDVTEIIWFKCKQFWYYYEI